MKSNKIILTEKCIVCYTFQLQNICHMRWAFKLNWKPIYLVAWHYMTHCIHKICNFVQFNYFSIIFSIKFIRYSIAHTNSNRSNEWKNEIINFSIWNWIITIFYELVSTFHRCCCRIYILSVSNQTLPWISKFEH